MRTKINISKIKKYFLDLLMAAFVGGGWSLFIFSEINKQEEMTKEINKQTREIRKEIYQRDTTVISQTSHITQRNTEFIQDLIAELDSERAKVFAIRDSLEYYKIFKEIISTKVKYTYDVKSKGNTTEYILYDVKLKTPPEEIMVIKNDSCNKINSDSI